MAFDPDDISYMADRADKPCWCWLLAIGIVFVAVFAIGYALAAGL